ncbi:MAG: DHA2 family efflux MFS transporter permease subunit [Thermomicrobiales bacterium]|nr:DHA2 family efflux MFS transporter permease subunit [Thermomicrobiales bacterium]
MIDRRLRNTALLVAACYFMENLDGTIVTTAIPQISASLNATAATVSLVVTAYLLALATLIPLSGWLTQRFGSRVIFLTAIIIFTLASLGCGLSQNVETLILMRVVQGIGGAMMVPVGRMVVLGHTEKEDLIRITAYIIWPALIAPVIAPLLGGIITEYFSWHWMFLINIPIGIACFVAAWILIDEQDAQKTAPLDIVGAILTTASLGAITWGAHMMSEASYSTSIGVLILLMGVGLLVIAVRHLLRVDTPLLNLRTLSIETFRVSTFGFFMYALIVWSVPFILPLLFQEVFGWSPVQSGAAVLWVFAGNISIKPATTWMLNRFGFRNNLLFATTGVTLSVAAFSMLRADTPFIVIAILAFVSGVFRSIGFTAYNTLAFSDVPKGSTTREASALFATVQQVAGAIGIVVTMLAITAGFRWGSFLSGDDLQNAYSFAFITMAIIATVPLMMATRISPQAGDQLRKH